MPLNSEQESSESYNMLYVVNLEVICQHSAHFDMHHHDPMKELALACDTSSDRGGMVFHLFTQT